MPEKLLSKIDFTVPIIDNYGDMGFAVHLACLFMREFHTIHIRFWTEDEELFRKILPHFWEQNIHFHQLHNFETEKEKNAFRCNFFWYRITDISLSGCQTCINFDYLQFASKKTEKAIESLHLTTYTQVGTKIVHFIPTLSQFWGGVLEPLVGQNSNKQITESKRNITGIFVYPETLLRLLPILSNFPEQHFLLFGITENQKQDFFKNQTTVQQNKNIEIIPFCDLVQFEEILQTCNRCFIRGENSLMLALHKRIPFLWDIYKESNHVQEEKMQDFLTSFSPEISSEYREIFILQSKQKLTKEETIIWTNNVQNFIKGKFDDQVQNYPKDGKNLFEEVKGNFS
jgi:hypothetical protein